MPQLLLVIVLGVALWAFTRRRADDPAEPELASSGPLDLVAAGARALVARVGVSVNGLWSPPASADPYLAAIAAAELRYGIPPNLWLRQLDIESDHFAPDVVFGLRSSTAGAIGIAQFMPDTAAELKIDAAEPYQAIDAGARYVRSLYDQFGDWTTALAAYNWGMGNVRRKGISNLPRESIAYATKIITEANAWG